MKNKCVKNSYFVQPACEVLLRYDRMKIHWRTLKTQPMYMQVSCNRELDFFCKQLFLQIEVEIEVALLVNPRKFMVL